MVRRAVLSAMLLWLAGCSADPGPSEDVWPDGSSEIHGDLWVPDVPADSPGEALDSLDSDGVLPSCGNGVCDMPLGETWENCPEECPKPAECGDETCEGFETCLSCPLDCGECVAECGNERCDPGEDCESCPGDCGTCSEDCGDDVCDALTETCINCPADCGPCAAVCGDGFCQVPETCTSCQGDCGPCVPVCGDGVCDETEDCETCSADCGGCLGWCGDTYCEGDEDCENCPEDCGACGPYCGDNTHNPQLGEECDDGNNENGDGCSAGCLIEPFPVDPGSILITEIMKDPNVEPDSFGEWFEVYNPTYSPINLNGWVIRDAGLDMHRIFHPDGVTVHSFGHLVLGFKKDMGANGGVNVHYQYSDFYLSNSDDAIILSCNDVVIDQVHYKEATFPNQPGKSLSLSYLKYNREDNDKGENWCVGKAPYGSNFGSPGLANPVCDVTSMCGDSVCEAGETCQSCPQDCGQCPVVCGNGLCQLGETCMSCPLDCGFCCGNSICEPHFGENHSNCPSDCPYLATCGNGVCDSGETCQTCIQDCGACPAACGNGLCETGENCLFCPADCGYCCGNGVCDSQWGETATNCPQDCFVAPVCGDGKCNGSEKCSTCAQDCGECVNAVWCRISGEVGQVVHCPLRIAGASASATRAAGLEWFMEFNSQRLSLVRFQDTYCTGTVCVEWNIPPHSTIQPSGHSLTFAEHAPGKVKTVLFHASVPSTLISTARFVVGVLQGDPHVVDAVFVVTQAISPGAPEAVSLSGVVGTSSQAVALRVVMSDVGILLTSAVEDGYCGDSLCSPHETCELCSLDCGPCSGQCGNGVCDGIETCSNCPQDCGYCPAVCGDGACSGGETCFSCSWDCGDCCGNGLCDVPYGESCSACPSDCGDCCGNGTCESAYGESCGTCPLDCGDCCGNGVCEVARGEDCGTCALDCGLCCGDGTCEPARGENCGTCAQDCGVCCGNGVCEAFRGEHCGTCPTDCGTCPADCGDGTCDGGIGETCATCPSDCGVCCGNGTCNTAFGETCQNCPGDCGMCCGNGTCEALYGETCVTCPGDCGSCCGNGTCSAAHGENCVTCPSDCGACCGNGTCTAAHGEDCTTCPQDCGVCCGDGICNEVHGETCETCVADCGACIQLGWCALAGAVGSEVRCPIHVFRSHVAQDPAAALEFRMGFNSAVASFQRFETLTCVGQVCQPWNAPPNDTLQPTGHTAAWLQTAPGNIKAVFYHATSPMAPLSAAYLQSGNVQGSSLVMTLVFQMKSTVLPQAAQPMLLTGVKASSPTAVPMQVVVDEGVIRTTSL